MEDANSQNFSETDGKLKHMEKYFKEQKEGNILQPADNTAIHEDFAVRYEPKALKKILRCVFFTIFVLIIGGLGGIIADRWFIPYIVTKPGFSQFAWLQRIKENTIIVKTTEEVKISEDLAMIDAISKAKSSVVKIIVSYALEQKTSARLKKPPAPEIYAETINGVVITGDGFVLARPSGFIPPEKIKDKILKSASYKVIFADKREFVVEDPNRIYSYVSQGSAANPLAKTVILKIEASNLPMISFGDISGALLGGPVAVLGQAAAIGSVAKTELVASPAKVAGAIGENWNLIYFDTEAANKDFYVGAPLINLKGEMLGLNIIDDNGKMTNAFLSMEDLKVFIDSVLGKK